MSSNDTVNSLYQDMMQTEKTVASLERQVQRLQKAIRIDELEFAVDKQKTQNQLMEAVAVNTELTSEVLSLLVDRETDAMYSTLDNYRTLRLHGASAHRKRLTHIKALTSCKQKVVPECPCGKHKGIMFLDNNGEEIETRCPESWWLSLSRIAFEEHRLSSFVETTPRNEYLQLYTK
jgi:hypothetical protein